MFSMKRLLSLLFISTIVLFAGCTSSPAIEYDFPDLPKNESPRVVGYLPSWSYSYGVKNYVDFDVITHLNIAFGNPYHSGKFGVSKVSDSKLLKLTEEAHKHGAKVLISLGGAGAPDYTEHIKPENLATTVDNLVNWILEINADGIDVDLEGDKVNEYYEGFILALRAELDKHDKLLTAALGTWYADAVTDKALAAFDFINIMIYDGTGPWNPDSPGQHSSMEFVESDIAYWVDGRGLAPDKFVLGVPFYGYDFSKSASSMYTAYKKILKNNPDAYKMDEFDVTFYNGISTMKLKAELSKYYGGIMIWEITQDTNDEYSLLNAISEVYMQ